MKRLQQRVLLLFFCAIFSTHYAHATSLALNKSQLASIKQQNMGKRWLMLLWSVDCPPCFKELTTVQQLKQKYPQINVVLVNTDANDEAIVEHLEIIQEYQLTDLTNFHFAVDQGDQSRFLIDPHWYGELPRSYFVTNNGEFHGKSGVISQSILARWLIE
ncbi:TlpA family protein disulfide reductase [Shewanella woodyi]|uniref:Uncharacterized protein n=1 Tax=Shewanella woodyi (strain ATCC 51908 / MS32) TaxID=392500 RepID=B1KKP9_SHEWM|nr:redoxin domain-containing protein [Shewanella woodyi]ACA87266.1 conserved hypothetical protein [Shewanella woodyi ATCC 51908]